MFRVFIPLNNSTTGAGCTGLTSSSTNLVIAFCREFDASFTTFTGANIETITTIGTYQAPSSSSKVRFKAVDATNAPGLYEIHVHDSATAFGSGDTSSNVIFNVLETSTTALLIGPNLCDIPLVPWDWTDGVRLGLTALPNAAAGANGGLPLGDASARVDVGKALGQAVTLDSNNVLNVSMKYVAGDATAATRLAQMFTSTRLITVDNSTFSPTTTAFETDQTVDAQERYTEQVLFGIDGNNVGVTVPITGYAFTNSKVKLTVELLPTAPSNGHRFLIMGRIEQ